MRRLRVINKLSAIILAASLALLSLAACSNGAPSLDLSQNDPFGTPPETTSAEPSSDESTYSEDTDTDDTVDLGPIESGVYETTAEETTTEETTEPEETFPAEIDGLTFMYTPNSADATCSINTIIGASNELVIPETIDGYTVTALSKGVFSFTKDIQVLTLPSTVRSIADGVFTSCSSLNEVHIADINAWLNIDFKSQSASPLYQARRILFNGETVSDVTVPEGMTEINAYAFYNFRTLNSIYLPSSIEEIGAYAFSNSGIRNVFVPTLADWFEIKFGNTTANPLSSARNLYVGNERVRDVVVPESITTINPFCFYGFSGISSVEIHSGVKSIGASAFLECSSISTVVISDIASWCAIDFENENANPLSAAKTLSFNNGTDIYPLSAVEIPATATKISPYAFSGCTNIVAVTFAEGSQLTTIGTGAFKGCTNLSTIYIPDSVTVIESLAFSLCPSIASYFEFDGANYLGNFTNPCHALMSLIVPDGQIASDITSFTIPSTTKIIYQAAFSYCTSLESIVIPDSVAYIGNSAFYNCSALKSVTLGNGITEIGNSVFCNCSALQSLTVPESVTTIGRSAISGCSSLTSLTLPNGLTYIDQYAFRDCKKLASLTIPSKVNYIGSCAFSGCEKLTNVIFDNLSNWYAGTTKISSGDLSSASVAAYYLTDDYLLQIWTKK